MRASISSCVISPTIALASAFAHDIARAAIDGTGFGVNS
jgi:hypothetical protein